MVVEKDKGQIEDEVVIHLLSNRSVEKESSGKDI